MIRHQIGSQLAHQPAQTARPEFRCHPNPILPPLPDLLPEPAFPRNHGVMKRADAAGPGRLSLDHLLGWSLLRKADRPLWRQGVVCNPL